MYLDHDFIAVKIIFRSGELKEPCQEDPVLVVWIEQ